MRVAPLTLSGDDHERRMGVCGDASLQELFVEEAASESVHRSSHGTRARGEVTSGVSFRIVSDSGSSFAWANGAADESVTAAVETANAALAHARGSLVTAPARVGATGAESLIPDPAHRGVVEAVYDLASEEASGRAIVSVTLQTHRTQRQVSNSFGDAASFEDVRASLTVAVRAESLGSDGFAVVATQGSRTVDSNAAFAAAKRAVEQALSTERLRVVRPGPVVVVFAPGAGGILIHEACGHALEADTALRGRSVLAARRSGVVAPPSVSVVDDSTIRGLWGSLVSCDDEGSPARARELVRAGEVCGLLGDLSTSTARGADRGNGRRESFRHPPVPRMTNTYLAAGVEDAESIVAATRSGLLVTAIGEAFVNTQTGSFRCRVTSAREIRNGQLGSRIRPAWLEGDLCTALASIDAVAADLEFGLPGTCLKLGQRVPVSNGNPTFRVPRGLHVVSPGSG